MTAQSVGVFTIEFPDPYTLPYYNDKFYTLNSNISFQYPIRDSIRTLSTNGASAGNDPYGILFVPDLTSDNCRNSEAEHVPKNATRRTNLPNTDYSLVAIAPWYSPECITQYFESARSAPTKAFLVYQPGNGTDTPPLVNDPSWGLGDGGSWKTANHFPVYAISGAVGGVIIEQLSLYSGNITTVPHGHDLASIYSPTDYIRLWATIDTGSGNQLPSLWVFLVIVLGLLIFIIGLTSVFMHLVQRKRRNALRQRVINGEIDLEALGIKRLTIPREYLEKMPLYTYNLNTDAGQQKEMDSLSQQQPQSPSPVHISPSSPTQLEVEPKPMPTTVRRSSAPSSSTTVSTAFCQPTCPICLDDFVNNTTQVRELPCRHIFHPDCLDPFLLSNSSLCPMCKKSVLPVGYCPPNITNAMVRRERILRRNRQRANNGGTGHGVIMNGSVRQILSTGFARGRVGANPENQTQTPSASTSSVNGRIPNHQRRIGLLPGMITIGGRRVFSAPVRSQRSPPFDIEMAGNAIIPSHTGGVTNGLPTTTGTQNAPGEVLDPAQPNSEARDACPSQPLDHGHGRREWARQRALTLLGHRRMRALDAAEEEDANAQRGWRRLVRKVFP